MNELLAMLRMEESSRGGVGTRAYARAHACPPRGWEA